MDIVEVYQFERPIGELTPDNVGLSLADGKERLHRPQQVVIGAQSEEIFASRRICS
jgi:hypothetical protein